MQIRVITLDATSSLVREMKSYFPGADVKIQTGIDVRKTPTMLLQSSGLITHSAVNSIEHGRRWNHELGTKGAVGIAHANRLALEEDVTQPLLLLEDDCYINDRKKLMREVKHLLIHADKLDIAVFGGLYRGRKPPQSAPWLPDGFKLVRDKFWLLHCVLYTPRGRRRVSQILYNPLDMQIDSLYGSEAQMGNLTVAVQLHSPTATQRLHVSSIQTGDGTDHEIHIYILPVIVALVLCHVWCKCKGVRKHSIPIV